MLVYQGLVLFKFLDIATVGWPTHPFRLGRKRPCRRVGFSDQAHFDLLLSVMGAVRRRHELRSVSDCPSQADLLANCRAPRGSHRTEARQVITGQTKYHFRPPRWRGKVT